MANVNNSPNMNLPVPIVSQEPGPQYATDVNSCLNTIDSHDHSSGKGLTITPAGMSITSDLSFGGNNVTQARSVRLTPQSVPISGASDVAAVYVSGADLYYNDTSQNQVRLTNNGSPAGTTGSIANLNSPASASYVAPSIVFQSGVNIAANVDVRNVILRNSTVSSKGLTLQPPGGMAADYNIVLPPLPGAQTFIGIDASGNIASVASVSLGITNSMLNGSIRTAKIFTGDQIAVQTTKISTTYQALPADGIILADTSGGAYTITLVDTTGGAMNGYTLRIKKTTNDYNVLTIAGTGGQLIDAAGTTTLNTYEESITLICNSDGNWNLLDRFYPENWISTSFGAVDGFVLHGGSAQASFSRRVGDSLQCRVYLQSVDTSAKIGTIEVPNTNNLQIDANKLNNSGSVVGMAWILDQNNYWTNYASLSLTFMWAVCFNSALSVSSASYKVYLSARGNNSAFTADNFNSFFSSNTVGVAAEFTVPIVGWN